MAQMASLLVVTTVFVALWTLNIYILQSERGGGAYTRDKTTYAGTWAKIAGGGLIREGGAYLRDSTVYYILGHQECFSKINHSVTVLVYS